MGAIFSKFLTATCVSGAHLSAWAAIIVHMFDYEESRAVSGHKRRIGGYPPHPGASAGGEAPPDRRNEGPAIKAPAHNGGNEASGPAENSTPSRCLGPSGMPGADGRSGSAGSPRPEGSPDKAESPRISQTAPAVSEACLLDAVASLERQVQALDPEVLEPSYAGRLVEIFSRAEKLSAAGKALAARQVSSSGVWRTSGERSPAHWVARKTGTSIGRAADVLNTAQKVAELAATDRALRSGELSETQAAEIASAAAASPSSEGELLQTAKDQSVTVLKQHCARVKAASHPDERARHEAIFRSRYLRSFTDEGGGFRLDGRLTPESGAVVMAALEPIKQDLAARGKNRDEKTPSRPLRQMPWCRWPSRPPAQPPGLRATAPRPGCT